MTTAPAVTGITIGDEPDAWRAAGFTVADDGSSLIVTLTTTNGVLSNLTDANLGVPGVQLTGTTTSINTALSGARFIATTSGAASIGVNVTDGVNTPATGTYNLNATLAASG